MTRTPAFLLLLHEENHKNQSQDWHTCCVTYRRVGRGTHPQTHNKFVKPKSFYNITKEEIKKWQKN